MSAAVKRLMREARELKEPTEQYYAQPLDVGTNLVMCKHAHDKCWKVIVLHGLA